MNLYHGDCLEVLRTMPDNSVDSIVTDPPYGLSFMGKKWDYDVPSVDVWAECLRVLKPGGHLLAFAGTRTQHRMAVRIEDAGFEIRDMIAWVYGSGFPKSHDVSKGIDKAAGAARDVVGPRRFANGTSPRATAKNFGVGDLDARSPTHGMETAPATAAARQWQGWGTALKPAMEMITMARKPLAKGCTVAANVLAHGTGALNIDGCRVGYLPDERVQTFWNNRGGATINVAEGVGTAPKTGEGAYDPSKGRWPANLIHDGSEEVLAGFPESNAQKSRANPAAETEKHGIFGVAKKQKNGPEYLGDSGSAARFFYCAKASKRDRDEGLDGFAVREAGSRHAFSGLPDQRMDREQERHGARNHHPTVKPTDLMRYLCRLVTPPGGTVLDPFMGSGSTGKAASLEGFKFIGIEREAEYLEIARARIEHVGKLTIR